jgi:hypothetical protein
MSDTYKTGVESFDKVFSFLSGDMCWEDHGGAWYRKVSPSKFHVVRILNWMVETGEGSGYNVHLVEVDTDDEERLKSSLESCGYSIDDDGAVYVPYSGDVLSKPSDEETRRLIFCECMNGHGAYAPLEDENGEEFEPLFAQMVERSDELVRDPEAYEEAMNRTVNKLGSTAREYQEGDINSAMLRGIHRGDTGAEIMGVMTYGRDNLDSLRELAELTQDNSNKGDDI